jgi:hypothetical protein
MVALFGKERASATERTERVVPITSYAARFSVKQRESCVVMDRLFGKRLQPFINEIKATLRYDILSISRDEASCLWREPCPKVMPDGLRPLLVCLEIRRSVDVEPCDFAVGPVSD